MPPQPARRAASGRSWSRGKGPNGDRSSSCERTNFEASLICQTFCDDRLRRTNSHALTAFDTKMQPIRAKRNCGLANLLHEPDGAYFLTQATCGTGFPVDVYWIFYIGIPFVE